MRRMEAFLEEVIKKGWSTRRRREFIRRYGRTIRGSILYHIRMKFGERPLAAIGDYLLSLQDGKHPRSKGGVVGELLDIACNTWQDVLNDVFKEDGLIHKYHRYLTKLGDEAQGAISFPYFLSKSVHYKFLDNLQAGLSDKEILDRIVDLKREVDRRFYIDELRSRYRDYVEGFLRSRYPELRHLNNVIDYFFERFIPQSYPALRQAAEPNSKERKNFVDLLLERFGHDDCQKGSGYIRQVYSGMQEMPISDADADERTGAEGIPLNDEINYYWDQLIRCLEPDPSEIEELIEVQPTEGRVLCWACAKLKGRLKRREQKENLIAFIVFYSSKRGVRGRDALGGSQGLEPENLTLERVVGRDLRWREDVCRGIFGKYIRKDRVIEEIKREILKSDYSYFITK